MKKILFIFDGLASLSSYYSEVLNSNNYKNIIYSTKPSADFENPELRVNWIQKEDYKKIYNNGKVDYFFFTGWNNLKVLWLAIKLKIKYKTKLVCHVDNINRYDFRQKYLGYIALRFINLLIDAFFVPGKKSRQFLNYLGVNNDKIFEGLYGASSKYFNVKNSIENREKEIVYVGQYIDRKNIRLLYKAFNSYINKGGKLKLRLVGSGPIKLKSTKHIIVDRFYQKKELGRLFNNTIAIILISKIEHWGIVVCEAAACGNLLILGPDIGSADDLYNEKNGFLIKDYMVESIVSVFFKLEKMSAEELKIASKNSIKMASNYNESMFKVHFQKIVEYL